MDLRVRKTKLAIKEAFFQMRKDIPLEKIKVKDICEKAMINKTTFYKHYNDIYMLNDQLEQEAVALVLHDFSAKNEIFINPERFIKQLPMALNAHKDILFPLFHDRFDCLFIILEKQLKDCYSLEQRTMEKDILLTFAVGGALHTMRELKYKQNCDDTLLANKFSKILRKLSEL